MGGAISSGATERSAGERVGFAFASGVEGCFAAASLRAPDATSIAAGAVLIDGRAAEAGWPDCGRAAACAGGGGERGRGAPTWSFLPPRRLAGEQERGERAEVPRRPAADR